MNNYEVSTTKELNLRINSNFTYEVTEKPERGTKPYKVHNINAFFSNTQPEEFLHTIIKLASQESIELTVEHTGQRYVIMSGEKAICTFKITKMHVVIESDMMGGEMDLRYGNAINTFTVLQYVLSCLNISSYIDIIKKSVNSNYSVLVVGESSQCRRPVSTFKLPSLQNTFDVLFTCKKPEVTFRAIFCLNDKSIRFSNFLAGTAECYGEDEVLYEADIQERIDFYTSLKDAIDDIQMYLETLETQLKIN